LDERQDLHRAVWQAADIFCSLADNVQETFGLTPLEAMAAGLPQVVSDWNGYRDTVRHGVDGFRVPAFPAVERDPTGAGDSFLAGFAYGLSRSLPPHEALRLGNYCGSLAVGQLGVPRLSASDFAPLAREMSF
ncbi:MAG: glycosyltransferase, partial [Deltaproteobacteria bacterium]|nr:glycosyltransferase [Deltaproteobacteria bacterium]